MGTLRYYTHCDQKYAKVFTTSRALSSIWTARFLAAHCRRAFCRPPAAVSSTAWLYGIVVEAQCSHVLDVNVESVLRPQMDFLLLL